MKKPPGDQRRAANETPDRAESAGLSGDEGENVFTLLLRHAGVLVDDLAVFDDVTFAGRHHEPGLAEGFDDFLVGIGDERKREVVRVLEFLLFLNGVGADADDRDAFFREFGIRIAQRAALLGAAAGESLGIKENHGVFVVFIHVGEVQRRAGVGDAGNNGRGVADFEGFTAGDCCED